MKVSPRDIMHPEDEAALEHLKSIPLFDAAVSAFIKTVPYRQIRGMNLAQRVRLGPKQLPEIYEYLKLPLEVFDIPEPEFYLEQSPIPNAYTYGTNEQQFIVIHSGLVDLCEKDELQAVIGHEVGHIVCGHVLYFTMAEFLMKFGTQFLGPLRALTMPIQLGLLYWHRRSELSSDRAGAVVMKGPDSVVDTMIRLAGGPKAITEEIDVDLYVQQVDDYDQLLESKWDELLIGLQAMQATHPFPAVRAREIRKWCATDEFQRCLDVLEGKAASSTCPSCGAEVRSEWKFCKGCGTAVKAEAKVATRTCPSCGAEVGAKWKFCKGCGATVAAPPKASKPKKATP